MSTDVLSRLCYCGQPAKRLYCSSLCANQRPRPLTKVCKRCGIEAGVETFAPSRNICKRCLADGQARYQRENPLVVQRRNARWKSKNAASYRESQREYQRLRNQSNATYLSKYGITLDEYDVLLAAQGGVCLICGQARPINDRRMPVDHDHTTGRIRGILCDPCNKALGHFGDDLERLRSAVAYLEAAAARG